MKLKTTEVKCLKIINEVSQSGLGSLAESIEDNPDGWEAYILASSHDALEAHRIKREWKLFIDAYWENDKKHQGKDPLGNHWALSIASIIEGPE